MNAEVKGKNLIITIPFDAKGQMSASGKSRVHASTRGNKPCDVKVGEKALTIGVNAYTPVS